MSKQWYYRQLFSDVTEMYFQVICGTSAMFNFWYIFGGFAGVDVLPFHVLYRISHYYSRGKMGGASVIPHAQRELKCDPLREA